MAILKLVPFKKKPGEEYINCSDVIKGEIDYIMRSDKIIHNICGGHNFVMGTPAEIHMQFMALTRWYNRDYHVPVRHLILSLDPYSYIEDSVTPYQLAMIADRFCQHEFGYEHQVLYAVHEDSKSLHVHILVNTVGLYNEGRLLRWDYSKKAEIYEWLSMILKMPYYWKGNHPIENLKMVYGD